MESLLYIIERIEREVGFGVWALNSFSMVPSLFLFLGSAALCLLGAFEVKRTLKKLNGFDLDGGIDYTRTARRIGSYYKLVVLIGLQLLWTYSLVASFSSVLSASPF